MASNDECLQFISVGIVGETKNGLSSLANALMGYEFDEDGVLPSEAAKIDDENPPKEPCLFLLPEDEKIGLWDLPAIGMNHSLEDYTCLMNKLAENINLIIIVFRDVVSTVVRSLIEDAMARQMPFVLVRTHVDETIMKAAKRKAPESEVVATIKKNTLNDLSSIDGLEPENVDLYLVDCYQWESHDLGPLKKSLIKKRSNMPNNIEPTKQKLLFKSTESVTALSLDDINDSNLDAEPKERTSKSGFEFIRTEGRNFIRCIQGLRNHFLWWAIPIITLTAYLISAHSASSYSVV